MAQRIQSQMPCAGREISQRIHVTLKKRGSRLEVKSLCISIENNYSGMYIPRPVAAPVMQLGQGPEKQPGNLHRIEQGRGFMDAKTIIVHCTFSEDDRDISDIIEESFRIFLQKELRTFAKTTHDGVS